MEILKFYRIAYTITNSFTKKNGRTKCVPNFMDHNFITLLFEN